MSPIFEPADRSQVQRATSNSGRLEVGTRPLTHGKKAPEEGTTDGDDCSPP